MGGVKEHLDLQLVNMEVLGRVVCLNHGRNSYPPLFIITGWKFIGIKGVLLKW